MKTRATKDAITARRALTKGMDKLGKTLTLRVLTLTVDDVTGKITNISSADTTFRGDLQYGRDLDMKLVRAGIVEVGDAVLYIEHDALTTDPQPRNIVVEDSVSQWEILSRLERPQLGGNATMLTYRCKRRIIASDTSS